MTDASRSARPFMYAVAAFAVYALVGRAWVTEDAYITFRAVENLFAGQGLVYNPGERTEVYTHPLWMLCLTLLKSFGLPLHSGAILLGLVFSGAALAILGAQSFARRPVAFPFAIVALVSISGFRDFATAGMEYSLLYLLLVLLFTLLEKGSILDRPFAIGALLALLYLARPEMGLVLAYYSLFAAREGVSFADGRLQLRFRAMAAFGAAIVLLAGGYHLFRAVYFHDIFPNTYYAKAGLAAYYKQGLLYLAHTLTYGPAILIALAVLAGALIFHRARALFPRRLQAANLRELGATVLAGFYIVRVGGDFMAFRFFLPEIVMLALIADRLFRARPDALATLAQGLADRLAPARLYARLHARNPLAPAWLGLGFFALLSLLPTPRTAGAIADERRYFFEESGATPISLFFGQQHRWGEAGAEYKRLAACLEVDELWITNSQAQARCLRGAGLGFFGVASRPDIRILDEQALPNRDVALMPVLLRWRPGHEHYVDLSKVIERGAAFCASGEPAYDRVMATPYGIVLRLDPALLATLPDLERRMAELVRLKAAGSRIIPRLEERYGVSVEDLARSAPRFANDPLLRQKTDCWQSSRTPGELYFY